MNFPWRSDDDCGLSGFGLIPDWAVASGNTAGRNLPINQVQGRTMNVLGISAFELINAFVIIPVIAALLVFLRPVQPIVLLLLILALIYSIADYADLGCRIVPSSSPFAATKEDSHCPQETGIPLRIGEYRTCSNSL